MVVIVHNCTRVVWVILCTFDGRPFPDMTRGGRPVDLSSRDRSILPRPTVYSCARYKLTPRFMFLCTRAMDWYILTNDWPRAFYPRARNCLRMSNQSAWYELNIWVRDRPARLHIPTPITGSSYIHKTNGLTSDSDESQNQHNAVMAGQAHL